MCLFAEQVFRSTYFCCWKHIAADCENFFLSTLEKNHQMLHSGPWSSTYDLGWIKNKKSSPCFSKNVLKIFPIHVYKFSFFNTSNRYAYRIWSNYFWPCWKPLVWETQGRLLSEVFERKADYVILRISSKKTIALIHQEWKSTWNVVKITFSCGNYQIFMFFFMLFTLVVDQGQHLWIIIQQFTIKVPVKTAKQSMSAALD